MNLFGLVPQNSDNRLRFHVETEISKWLKNRDLDADTNIRKRLSDLGIRGTSVLVSLAQIKSLYKYKYSLNPQSLQHILDLAQKQTAIRKLIQDRPYLLAKVAMIYEHAPAFLFGGNASQQELDECLLNFAKNYRSKFLEYSVKPKDTPLTSPYHILSCTFWDGELWHPAAYLKKAYEENLLGVEYCIDFHPFQANLNKLFPEDFNVSHRNLIREWVERTNLQLSIHSAIVGPHSTPTIMGQQLYYDPVDAMEIQKETVLLARDIGASSVVLHLVDPNRRPQLAEIIETAADSNVRVTVENYYNTPKIKQTSERFIEALDSLIPLLSKQVLADNFGITFDPGHYNIEGDDPIVAALRVSRWCKERGIHLTKIHATTNYGPLRCFPPNFSSDVHNRVSNLGIDNRRVIQLARSIGHIPLTTAEQIQPMIERDIVLIDNAQKAPLDQDYESFVQEGKDLLAGQSDELIAPADTEVEAYQFIAGISGIEALQEYLVYRRVQSIENMTSETAQAATLLLMKASIESQRRVLRRLPEILRLAIEAEGGVSKDSIGSICERLRDATLAEIQREDLNMIFAEGSKYQVGETICHEGTISDEIYYIKNGQAQVFLGDLPIATLNAGEVFGEMSLFYDMPRSATVKASMDNTEIGILKRQSLAASLKGKKDSAKAILFRLYSLLPERLRNLNAKYSHAVQILQSLNPSDTAQSDTDIDESLELDVAFEAMDLKELGALFSEDRVYAPGEIVFPEDTIADGAYLVKSGSVRVIRRDVQRQGDQPSKFIGQKELEKIFARDQFYAAGELIIEENMLLARLGRQEIIGEIALIDESDRSATIVSEGVTLGYLSKEAFDKIVEEDAELSYKFLLTLCSTMMSKISRLNRSYLRVLSEIHRHSE
ncbi:cyclic nucleotide-binding domain-containing protein [Candidatus Poribacteria bacterium]|nr:cyclic nucleotide-binding domain-containing protein [Candidatus Poribacteria bacterium]